MQDLASDFPKKFSGSDTPDPHSGRGRRPPAPNTQPGLWLRAGHKRPDICWDPNLGPPQLFRVDGAPVC